MRALVSLFALLAMAAAPALAQTTGAAWRPFRVGHTHTFEVSTTPVELETVRLAAGRLIGADSVYDFADFYRRTTQNEVYPPTCPTSPSSDFALFRRERNTAFGAELRVPAQGSYELRMTDGATYQLPRRALPVGATWAFAPGITATVMLLEVQLVGTAAIRDSVMAATLSGGGEVMLSKSFGLLNAPDLRTLALAAAPLALHLLTIPERALGGLSNDTPPDWQPGDSVLWSESGPSICQSGWALTRYLNRRVNLAGDSVYYSGTTQSVTIDYGVGCSSGRVVRVDPPQVFTRARYVGVASVRASEPLRQVMAIPPAGQGFSYVNQGAYYLPPDNQGCFSGWRFRYSAYYSIDSCRSTLDGRVDFGRTYETLNGFGTLSTDGVWGDQGRVVWFRLNGQTCGTRPADLRLLLVAPKLLPAESVQLFPNPATTAARLRLTGTKGGALTLTATDALGRRVWQQTQVVGPAAGLVLPTGAWAPGVYYVRVALPEGARTVRLVSE
ncbi:MAG: T9SS type A sorting domain-containing protein [Hymenobacteraceae bacterium]|nr:T9SS type A sorting domain-containing protein [Hymenobacteraceae bacterium]